MYLLQFSFCVSFVITYSNESLSLIIIGIYTPLYNADFTCFILVYWFIIWYLTLIYSLCITFIGKLKAWQIAWVNYMI